MIFKLYGTDSIPKDKVATFNYKPFESDNIAETVKFVNTHAVIPCAVNNGHRLTDNITEIYNWIRLDVDKEGESKKIDKALKNVFHIKKPSTSHKKYPYKWHYLIPIENVSQNYDGYKLQYHKFLVEFGIEIKDKSMASVVQNTNPMGEDGIALTYVNKGKPFWVAPDVVVPKRKKLKEKHSDISKDEVKKLLSHLDPDMPYHDPGSDGVSWLKVGMALYDWCPKRGLKLFDYWSKKGEKYDGTTRDKWDDFAKSLKGDITIGSLIHWVHGVKKDPTSIFGKEKGNVDNTTEKEVKEFSLTNLPWKLTNDVIKKRGKEKMLFKNLISWKMHSFLFGASGSNKTTLTAWIAIQVMKEYENMVTQYWSFDVDQTQEQAIYEYAFQSGFDDNKIVIMTNATVNDMFDYYITALDDEADLSTLLIVVDTFKFVTKNVNDKSANQKYFHFIKNLNKLGATVVTLGHTNKDGIKQSGTAEIEQDTEGLFRSDRTVDVMKNIATMTIAPGGRVKFPHDPKGISFTSSATAFGSNDGLKYHLNVLNSIQLLENAIDLASEVDAKKKQLRDEERREQQKKDQRIKDEERIGWIRDAIATIKNNPNKRVMASQGVIINEMAKRKHGRHKVNHKTVVRILDAYNDVEWSWTTKVNKYVNGGQGRPMKVYKLI